MNIRNLVYRLSRVATILMLAATLASCEQPQVYGSVGYSNFSGGYGGGFGTSVRIGGRIY
ncbi:MAG: hypothetical protein QNJ00_10370 [Woeseiaceae bacterium]|nr:hypothetical protein [Woeseiaceae bacterium]